MSACRRNACDTRPPCFAAGANALAEAPGAGGAAGESTKTGSSSVCPAACRISTQNAVCVGVPVHCCAAAAIGTGVLPGADVNVPLAARAWTVPVSGSSAPPRSAAVPCAVTVPSVVPAACDSDAE